MRPVLFNLGPLPISSLGVFLLLAFWLGITMTRRRSPAIGIDSNAIVAAAQAIAPGRPIRHLKALP